MSRRHVWVGLLILAVSGIAGAQSRALPDIDKHSERPAKAPRELSRSELGLVQPGRKIQYEERLGVPTFIWAAPSSPEEKKSRSVRVSSAAGRPDAAGEARRHAAAYASFYGLEKRDIESAKVVEVHDTGKGAIIVKLHEEVGGIEVFREELAVMMDRNLEPIALSGFLSGAPRRISAKAAAFRLDERTAVAIALADRTGKKMLAAKLVTTGARQGPYGFVDHGARLIRPMESPSEETASLLSEPARYKKVYFHTSDGFEPAYYVEVSAELRDVEGNVDNDMYSYVISATDGRLLFRRSLTVSDNFTYRLWADESGSSVDIPKDSPHGNGTTPHPTGNPDGSAPPYIPSSLHTLQAYPFSNSATDPWLPPTATETVGNNVDAYIDRFGANGFTPAAGDFRANLSSAGTFDYTYDPNADPLANVNQQKAAVTSLFYMDNFLHDYFYDAGFNEAARNAQVDNYGRGGIGGDDIRAEAQDGSGTNNANMSTPADGGRPRQQMFLWSGPQNETITVNSQPPGGTLPASYNPFQIGTAAFGPQAFDVTADVVRVDDGVAGAGGGTVNDGCEVPFTTPVAGKIAFIDRGLCGFAVKAANAAGAGAVGVIIANVAGSGTPGTAPNMATANPPCPAQPGPLGGCTAGTLSLNFADGEAWRATLALGTVNARLKRDPVVGRDGSLDWHVVAHEWGHYLSNRLVGNAAGLGNQQGGGMGEGWSDFVALLTTVREGDDLVASNASWNGAYPLVPYAAVSLTTDPYYFGIRRVPYSTNMTKDPLTFKHIMNGVALPCATVPIAFGCNGANNSQVHNTGEVWSTMLWEGFASLLNTYPFQEARTRMRDYLVASLKMTPLNPTFTEARDAVLAAAFAQDPADHALFCAAYARRGAGTLAVSPDRFSSTNAGVVESFECTNFIVFQSASLSAPAAACDTDTYLDNFENATLTVTFKNTGAQTLSNTTANISSANPNVFFANGGVMTFPPVAPFQTTTGTIGVSMFGASGIQDFYIDIAAQDPDISAPIPVAHLDVRGNADDVASSSASDSVEARLTAWVSSGTNGTWVQQQFLPSPPTLPPPPFSYAWHAPDQGSVSDIRLASPVVHVGAGGTTFTFKHRFSIEATFDGGVVETSIDNGATWQDIGAANLSPTYAVAPLVAGSPLAGRRAYTGNSAGYPALVTVTGTLGAAFADQDVRIRFRIASDGGVGGPGWDVDDIVFNNITNTPFSTVVAQPENPALSALSPANVWIGLRNSDDVGTSFDLKAEVFVNGALVGSGQIDNVPGGSSGFNNAKLRAIALALSSPGTNGICPGNTLSIRLSVRVTATGGHRSGTARLWFNDAAANSRFDVTIGGVTSDLYLRDGFVLGTTPGPGPKKTIDVFVDRARDGNPFKPFGTWSKTF